MSDRPTGAEPVRRRRTAAVTARLLLAAVVLGGVGFTAVTVHGADRTADTTVWTFPKRHGTQQDETRPKTPHQPGQDLADLLVPYGTDNFGRGPDLGEFGSDAVLSGARVTALRKESLAGLPRSQRRRLEKSIDRQRVTGMAMRSYVSTTWLSQFATDHAYTVSIQLARMENRAAGRDTARFQGEFLDALGVFRAGPRIKGHDNARCFLPPKDDDEKLDMMVCSAYVGDVLFNATVQGAKPLDTKGAAVLLRDQLDRLAAQGVAV
ncbi:hypothetical protein ACFOOM_13015 [Streptomyces echinoruber]|uniref:Secreted protein n=1 Tax=Streptomyces echinoruber TaxID=68898 RepID=A0A918RSG1_9ACTN|nr:hypothetical protein [Streptomyces echinoruber]GHA09277.1 hypothetical protein GCM10010389_55470 [Streptomyces echinoruber]